MLFQSHTGTIGTFFNFLFLKPTFIISIPHWDYWNVIIPRIEKIFNQISIPHWDYWNDIILKSFCYSSFISIPHWDYWNFFPPIKTETTLSLFQSHTGTIGTNIQLILLKLLKRYFNPTLGLLELSKILYLVHNLSYFNPTLGLLERIKKL